MKSRTLILWSVVLLGLAIVGFDFWARARIERLQAKAAELVENYAALGQQIQAAGRKAAAALRLNAERSRLASAGVVAPPQSGGSGSTASRSAINPLGVIASNPELKAQYLQLYRDSLDAKWNLLFHALGLSATQSDKFKDLLAQYAANQMQVAEVAAEQGLGTDSKPMQKLASQLNKQDQSDIAALLGPDGYATYQEYWQEHSVAPMIGDLAGNLPTGSLTLDQAEQLSHALAAASQKNQWGFVVYGTIDVDQAMSNAASVLTPDQLPVLSALLQKNQAYLQYQKLSASP